MCVLMCVLYAHTNAIDNQTHSAQYSQLIVCQWLSQSEISALNWTDFDGNCRMRAIPFYTAVLRESRCVNLPKLVGQPPWHRPRTIADTTHAGGLRPNWPNMVRRMYNVVNGELAFHITNLNSMLQHAFAACPPFKEFILYRYSDQSP